MGPEISSEARVRAILRDSPLIDGHNDAPWQFRKRVRNQIARIDFASSLGQNLQPPMHTDIARMRQGGMGGQFWSVFVPVDFDGASAVQATLEQIDTVCRLIEKYPDDLAPALTADDVGRIHGEGRLACLLGIEGGHCIHDSLGVLRQMARLGVRYMTLTHWRNTAWADAATDAPRHHGLTPFGHAVVREMNRCGILVDLSHVSAQTMHHALDTSQAPIIFSHSSTRAVCPHPRNVPDDVLLRVRDNGGVVMVNFAPLFVCNEVWHHDAELEAAQARFAGLCIGAPEAADQAMHQWTAANPAPRATIEQVADHIDHIRHLIGVEHIGIGGDYDGIESTPLGLEDVSCYPRLFVELLSRGYSDDDIRAIAGRNILRALRGAEATARRLQEENLASDALIDALP